MGLNALIIRGRMLKIALGAGSVGLLVGMGAVIAAHFTPFPMLLTWWSLMLVGATCGALRSFRSERGLWLLAAFAGGLGLLLIAALAFLLFADLANGHAVDVDGLVSMLVGLVGVVFAWSVCLENRRLAGRSIKVV